MHTLKFIWKNLELINFHIAIIFLRWNCQLKSTWHIFREFKITWLGPTNWKKGVINRLFMHFKNSSLVYGVTVQLALRHLDNFNNSQNNFFVSIQDASIKILQKLQWPVILRIHLQSNLTLIQEVFLTISEPYVHKVLSLLAIGFRMAVSLTYPSI